MSDVPGAPLVATLRRLLRPPAEVSVERCDLCAAGLPHAHPHLVDIETRRLLCACARCAAAAPAPGTRSRMRTRG